jgi:transcriptional regulator with XRE-family HTH domain
LTIQERLKDLRVERGLTLEQLAEQTGLSKSAPGSYERMTSRTSATMPLSSWQGFTA